MTTFAIEAWPDIRDEMLPVLVEHWHEVALDHAAVPLDIDGKRYDALHEQGALRILAARKDGVLIGYHVAIISTHLHYASTLCGFTDVYFVKPEHRSGRLGLRLFEAVEADLKAKGVKKLFTGVKLHIDQSRLMEHLGYRRTEYLYTKMIGE